MTELDSLRSEHDAHVRALRSSLALSTSFRILEINSSLNSYHRHIRSLILCSQFDKALSYLIEHMPKHPADIVMLDNLKEICATSPFSLTAEFPLDCAPHVLEAIYLASKKEPLQSPSLRQGISALQLDKLSLSQLLVAWCIYKGSFDLLEYIGERDSRITSNQLPIDLILSEPSLWSLDILSCIHNLCNVSPDNLLVPQSEPAQIDNINMLAIYNDFIQYHPVDPLILRKLCDLAAFSLSLESQCAETLYSWIASRLHRDFG